MTARSTSGRALFLAGLLAAVAWIAVNPRGHGKTAPQAQPLATASPAAARAASGTDEPPSATLAGRIAAPPAPAPMTDAGALLAAIARVEETRGGSETIATPEELRHYDDRRRFLAVQVAASREDNLDLPHDEAALAEMLLRGELVEMPAVTEDYVLYEIGTSVNIDPRTHYDAERNKNVPLFPSLAEYEAEDARLAAEGAGKGRAAAQAREERELLRENYGGATERERLFREHAAITRLARDFGGTAYVLEDANQSARFVARLLSCVRPQARDVIHKLARSYRERFLRPLPIASLVRSARYQRRLARVNSNASRVEASPHMSGEAFDVSYKFMAPEEQNFLMDEVAQLERQGLVEALRERNNSLHVYVFADGQRPAESRVVQYLDEVEEQQGTRRAPARRARGGARVGGVRAMRR